MTIDEFFSCQEASRQLFEAIRRAVESIGPFELRVTKSEISFRRRKPFASVWMPGQYLKNRKVAPLVLTLYFRHPDPSPRWKQIVEPYPGRFTHHLELYSTNEIDAEVQLWLQQAWIAAD